MQRGRVSNSMQRKRQSEGKERERQNSEGCCKQRRLRGHAGQTEGVREGAQHRKLIIVEL